MCSSLISRARRVSVALALLLSTLPLATPIQAAELVVDSSDGTVLVKGKWTTTSTTSGFLGADYLFRTPVTALPASPGPSRPARPVASKSFARWSAGPNRATNANYQINSNAGGSSIAVNQKNNGGSWQSLGSFDFQPAKGQGVTITDKADGVVVADAIRFVGPQGDAPAVSAAPQPAPSPAQQSAVVPAPAPPAANDAALLPADGLSHRRRRVLGLFPRPRRRAQLRLPGVERFTLFGMKVQIFQRQILQLRPDGGVQTMNMLDDGLLPYTRMNGSTFPAPDPNVINLSPKPDAPDYHAKTLEFVRSVAPDTLDGEQVNFARTFFSSVSADDAYPERRARRRRRACCRTSTSRSGACRRRAQRTIRPIRTSSISASSAASCTTTRAAAAPRDCCWPTTSRRLLTAAQSAVRSGRAGQEQQVLRPVQTWPAAMAWRGQATCPGSDLSNSFRRDRSSLSTPATAAPRSARRTRYPDGTVLLEKDLNLRVMLRLRDLLQQAGLPGHHNAHPRRSGQRRQEGPHWRWQGHAVGRPASAGRSGQRDWQRHLRVGPLQRHQRSERARHLRVLRSRIGRLPIAARRWPRCVDQALTKALKDAGYTTRRPRRHQGHVRAGRRPLLLAESKDGRRPAPEPDARDHRRRPYS